MSNTAYIVPMNGVPQFVKDVKYLDARQYLVDVSYDDEPCYKVYYDWQIAKFDVEGAKLMLSKYRQSRRMGRSLILPLPALDNRQITYEIHDFGLIEMMFSPVGTPFRFTSFPDEDTIVDFNIKYDGHIVTIVPLTKPARVVATKRNAYNPHHDAIYDIIKAHPYSTAEDIASYSEHDKEYVKKRLSELVDGGRAIQVGKKKSKKTKYMVYYYKAV